MSERPPSNENPPHSPSVGLHARLLLGGEALNPHLTQLPMLTKEKLGSLTTHNYQPFHSASQRERSEYWKNQQTPKHEQKNQWLQETTKLFTDHKTYFQTDEQGKRWGTLYKKLGLDTNAITTEKIDEFYHKYFSGSNNNSNIHQFVKDILSGSPTPTQVDLEAIEWLSSMFGEKSAQIVKHLIQAEGRLQTEPDAFVTQANAQTNGRLAINTLTKEDQDLLAFVYQPNLKYQRIDTTDAGGNIVRKFPDFELTEVLDDPATIARSLVAHNPSYTNTSVEELTRKLQQEQIDFKGWLAKHNLSNFMDSINQNLSSYREFLRKKYGLAIPDQITNLRVIPIHGLTAKYYGDQPGRLAFMSPRYPAIFLNFEEMSRLASQFQKKDYTELSDAEIGQLVSHYLTETHPHEYTHIVADIAYWSNPPNTMRPGKLGLMVQKPDRPRLDEHGALRMISRGTGLMEAVTEKLTKEWITEMGKTPIAIAYKNEQDVLDALIDKLATEDGKTKEEIFKKFVGGYFSPQEYRTLVRYVSGKEEGKPARRKHLLTYVYSFMEYESEKNSHNPSYPITLNFIKNTLTPAQKQELQTASLALPKELKATLLK